MNSATYCLSPPSIFCQIACHAFSIFIHNWKLQGSIVTLKRSGNGRKNLESVNELHNLLFFSSFNFLSNSMYDVLPFSHFHQTIENYNVMLKRFGNARKILESLNELYILLFFSCFNFLSNSIHLRRAFSIFIHNWKLQGSNVTLHSFGLTSLIGASVTFDVFRKLLLDVFAVDTVLKSNKADTLLL